jgi:redox-sensitive bicupin YhaK (pirin superfamily)
MTTSSASTTVLRRNDQFLVDALGGVLHANKPVVGGAAADGRSSAALFYWSHSHFTDDFEFGLHHHEGFEIITFVLDGTNSHYDTAGTAWTPLHAGDVQIIRAGSGISHNERVAKGTRAFQIWFDPNYHEALHRTPDYADHPASSFTPTRKGGFGITHYVGNSGPIRSLVEGLSIMRIRTTETTADTLTLGADRYAVVYAVAGTATVDGQHLGTDDALVLRDAPDVAMHAAAGADLFVVSLPAHPSYTPVRGR